MTKLPLSGTLGTPKPSQGLPGMAGSGTNLTKLSFPWCYTLKNNYQLGMIQTEVLWGKTSLPWDSTSPGLCLPQWTSSEELRGSAKKWLKITKVRKPQKDLPSQQAAHLFVPLEAGEPVAFCYRNRKFLHRRSHSRAWESLLLCGYRNPSRIEAFGAQETESLQICHPPAFSQFH